MRVRVCRSSSAPPRASSVRDLVISFLSAAAAAAAAIGFTISSPRSMGTVH